MRIGLDIMGGDHAPQVCIDGAINASQKLDPQDKIVLIGPEKIILDLLSERKASPDDFDIVKMKLQLLEKKL